MGLISIVGRGTVGPVSPICRLQFPASKGQDMDWKPGRSQSPTPAPVKDQVPHADSYVELSGGVKGTQVWRQVLCSCRPGVTGESIR